MSANDQSVEMEQLIAALRLDKNARRALEWTVADLCKQVPDSTSFLHSLFKYCADKQAGRLNRVKEIFALQALGSATEKAKAAVEKARILNSKNAIGRDRQRCAVKCDPGFAEDIENGKIYVSQKGLCRIFEPPQKDPIYTCRLIQENGLYKAIELAKGEDGADLPLLKEQEWKAWQENLNTLTHQEDIREAVLTSQGFVKANASIGDTAPSLVLLWDKIERFVEIILNPENEKKRKEEVEKFVRRIGELPLRQEGATLANGFEVAQQRINSDVATEQEDKVKLAAMGSRIDAVKAQLKRISVIEGPILLYVASLSEIRNPEALEKFEKVLVQVEAYCSGQQVNFVSANGDSLTAITHITPELSESAQASSSAVDASVVDLNPAHISAPVAKVYVGTGISGFSVDSSIDSTSSAFAPSFSEQSVVASSSSEQIVVPISLPEVVSTFMPVPDASLSPHFNEDDKGKGEESDPSSPSHFDEESKDESEQSLSDREGGGFSPHAYDRDDYGTGVSGTAEGGETEFIPSIFPNSFDDVLFDEAERLLVDNEKEVPSVDAEETDSDPNSPSKPLLSPKPDMHEFGWEDFTLNAARELFSSIGNGDPKKTDPAKKPLEIIETTKKTPGEKESAAASSFPKENDSRDEEQEKKERKKQGERKKEARPFRFPEKTIAHLPEDMISPSKDIHEEFESASADVSGSEKKEPRDRVKENIPRKKTQPGHTPHTTKRVDLDDEALGFVASDEIFESEEDARKYFMRPENHPPEGPIRRRRGNREGFGERLSSDEDEPLILGGGVIDPVVSPLVPVDVHNIAPPVVAPAVPAVVHKAKGLSPLYYALRELYLLLKSPEGFKYISIPRLNKYLEMLLEIRGNAALTIDGKILWGTLNLPPPSDFSAEQLLEALASGKNILEESIDKHQTQYFEQIRKELTKPTVKKYEPIGKCFYIENIGGVTYLMLRDGANPSDEELKEAIREYQVVCEDLCNKTDAKAYLLDDPFTRNKENQEKIATIMTRFGMELANDNTVQESNKAVHKAVHELSEKMKDPIPETAEDIKEEKDWTEELRLNYRVMSSSESCLIPDGADAKDPERVQYLDAISQWEEKPEWSYLNSVSILNGVLPELKPDTYKKEKVLAQVYPMPMDGALERAIDLRARQRKLHYQEEMQLQEAIKRSLQTAAAEVDEAAWLEEDCKKAKAEAEAFAKTVQTYEGKEECVEECQEADLAWGVQASLITYESEQLKRLEQKHQFVFEDVRGDGNCFYRAVADQMEQQGIRRFNQDGIELHTSLRLRVQGREFANGEWAGVEQLFKLVKETNVVIAVVDTRYPELGFRCYFRNSQGYIDETYYPSEFAREATGNKTIIRLAYTGHHYMSVRGHNVLTAGVLRAKFDIAECLQSRPAVVAPEPLPSQQTSAAIDSEPLPSQQTSAAIDSEPLPSQQISAAITPLPQPIQSQEKDASEQLRQMQRRANTLSQRRLSYKDKKSSAPVAENLENISNIANLSQFGIFHHQPSPPTTEKSTSEQIKSSVSLRIPVD